MSCEACEGELFIGSDNDICVLGLKRASTNAYINDATLVFTLQDSSGSNVSGATAVSMTYVAASNGDYRGVVASTVDLEEGESYTAIITSSNYGLRWELALIAVNRTLCQP